MKSTILFVTAILLSVGFLSLPSLVAAHSIDGRAQHLADQLDLDQAQTEAIDKLIGEHRDGMRTQMESQDLRGPERREHMRAQREALHGKIRDVLTAEQAEQFDHLISERHGTMSQHRGERGYMRGKRHSGRQGMMRKGRRGAGACDHTGFNPDFSELDISEGMRARLEAMHKEHRDAMEKMHMQHRDEMRQLIGEEELEKLQMPCAPEQRANGADTSADRDAQERG